MLFQRLLTSWSIRRKLLLLILTVLLPGAGIIVHDSIKDRRQELEDAKHRAILMVESLSAQQEQIAAGTRQMLSTLAQAPQVQSLDAEACNKLFRELSDRNPIYSSIGAATPDGNMFASSIHFQPRSVNIYELKHVEDTIKSLDFSAGEYIVGRLTHVPSINYGYPVLDADKRLIAIVTAGFRLTEYDSFIKKANLPPDSAVVILDHQGLRLYRYPENEAAAIGRPPAAGLEQIAGLDEGTYERRTDDGIYRLVAFKRLRLTETSSPYLLITAGVPKDKILQKANFSMMCNLLILGLAAAIAVSLALLLGNVAFARPISSLVNATQRFGSGEMRARTGLPHSHDEFGKLAQSFDSMADLTEQRNLESKKAKEELISALCKNDLILNAAGEGIVGLDEKGTVTFANPAARAMLGYEEEELIGKDLHPMIHHSFPDGTHYPVTECPMWLCLRNGTGCRVRDEVLWKKDGTGFPAAYSIAPIIEDGRVVGAVVTFRDISVRKRAEKALGESEEQFRATFELAAVGVANLDLDGRWLRVNHKLCEILGYSREEMLESRFQDMTHPDDVKASLVLGAQLIPGKIGNYSLEKRYVRKDGGIVWCNLTVALARDAEGRPEFFIAVIEDITERKGTREALRASEEHYRSLFDNMLNGYAYCKMHFEQGRPKDFLYLNVNNAFENLTGLRNVVGKNVSEVIPGILESDPGLLETYGRVALSGIPERLETFVESLGMWFSISVYSPLKEHFVSVFDVITERKQAEKALQESRQQLANIIDFLPDATFVINNEGEVMAWNKAIEEMTGVKASEMLGNGTYEYALPFYGERRPILIDFVLKDQEEIWSKYNSKYKSIARKGTEIAGEAYMPTLGAGKTYLYGTANVLRDSVGNIVGFIESIRDITKRKRAEEKLEESERKYRRLHESMTDGFVCVDMTGKIIEFNESYREMLGYTDEELLRLTCADLTPERWHAFEQGIVVDQILLKGYSEIYEKECCKKDGTVFPVELRKYLIKDKSGGNQGMWAIVRDISERKRAEEALRASEERFRLAMQGANDGLWDRNLDTGEVYYSPRWKSMLGYTDEELEHHVDTLKRLIHPDDLEAAEAKTSELIEGRLDHFEAEFRMRHKDGHYVNILSRAFLFQKDGESARLVGTHVDISECKAAERALAEEAIRRRILFEQSRDGIVVLDQNGKVYEANQRYAEMLGYCAEEIGQLYIWNWDVNRTQADLLERIRLADAEGAVFETRHRRKNGTIYDVEISRNGIELDGQKFVFCVCRDISQRKAAELALRDSEERLSMALAASRMGVWELDLTTNTVFWSPECYNIFGVKSFGGKLESFTEFVHPEDLDRVRLRIEQAVQERTIYKDEFRIIQPDGNVRWVLSLGQAEYDTDGRALRLIGVAQDITERKLMEEALRESEARLRQIIDLVPHMIFVKDWDGKYLLVNKAVAEAYNTSVSAFTGKYHADFHPDESELQKMFQDDREVMTKGESKFIPEEPFTDAQGNLRFLQAIKVPFRMLGDKTPAVLGVAIDITERKRAEAEKVKLEAELRQAQKLEAIGTLAGGIAHDFNNILQPMIGYTQMALNELSPSNPVRDDLEQVLNSSLRAKELVMQILAISRSTEEQQIIPIDISSIIKEALKLLRSSLPTSIEIRQNIQMGVAQADATQIHQVLMNLCTNAAHAMDDKGILEVRLSCVDLSESDLTDQSIVDLKPGPHLRLTVSDTGCGIDANTMERIFDPYFTTKEVGKGSGLGLAVVHGIVKRHEGAITVRSEPGKGTTFSVYIPRVDAQAETTMKVDDLQPRGSERLLLVDDEPNVMKMGTRLLERLGYKVTSQTDSVNALEIFRSSPDEFDLVITDYAMPKLTGLDFEREVRQIRPDMPVLLCTGFSEKITPDRVKELGMGFLMKPYDMRQISEKIRKILDARKEC